MNLLRLLGVCMAFALLPAASAQASVPGASTGPATSIGFDRATLTGVVNPNKEDTTYAFEYGTTTAYGARTPNGTASGNAGKDVDATVTGLTAATTYHYRLVAVNASGTETGNDMTFTTSASPYGLPPTVTIAALPATITFGRSTSISGQVSGPGAAGAPVQLQESPSPFAAYVNVGTAVAADASGNYAFTVEPGLNTRYRVVVQTTPAATSAEVEVFVRHRVGLGVGDSKVRRGQRVRFKGMVAPADDGRRVKIQRRSSSGFKTVASALLRKATGGRSSYAKRLRITRMGTYRVKLGADSDHAAGFSRKLTIRIGR